MTKRSVRLAATGLALGTALSLLGTAGSAQAAVTTTTTTVQAGSNIRAAATTNSRLLGTTKSESVALVLCYTRGQRVTVGGYTTDVWYYFRNVIDNGANPPHDYLYVWLWGGNVNVGPDPAPDIPHC